MVEGQSGGNRGSLARRISQGLSDFRFPFSPSTSLLTRSKQPSAYKAAAHVPVSQFLRAKAENKRFIRPLPSVEGEVTQCKVKNNKNSSYSFRFCLCPDDLLLL